MAAVRDELATWSYDASAGLARDRFNFSVRNSLNVSLGPSLPPNQESFYAGSLADKQYTANVDVSRGVSVGLAGPLNVAAGVEYRRDGYQVIAGERASWIDGGSLNQFGTGHGTPGSQVFPGFRPDNAVDVSRSGKSVYVDTEGDVLQQLRIGIAGRFEDFSDFGNTTNGNLTVRYTPANPRIIPPAQTTGFRAPSLGPANFSAVTANFLR